jgi:predicted nucleic-acid-binding Zn-ribbon protein
MAVAKCPDCGGADLYRSAQNTPANGMFGPVLLPLSAPGRFRVVVCKDCGLTRLYASTVDTQELPRDGWEHVSEPTRPLGLTEA